MYFSWSNALLKYQPKTNSYPSHIMPICRERYGGSGTHPPILVYVWQLTWWRRQMKTFSALLALCAGNSPVTGELPSQRPVTRSFDVVFDRRLNKRPSKQSRGWLFETPSCSLWRHCNESWELVPYFEIELWLTWISSQFLAQCSI